MHKLLSFVPWLAKAASYLAAFFTGKSKGKLEKEVEQLRNENKALRETIKRNNSGPVTDDDVDRMLTEWADTVDDR